MTRPAVGRPQGTTVQRFAVELDRQVVGIAVRERGGFTFYSSDVRFDAMDGEVFPRVRAILMQLEIVAAKSNSLARKEN